MNGATTKAKGRNPPAPFGEGGHSKAKPRFFVGMASSE